MASTPFAYECVKESGFLMDPNEHKRVGYVTDFKVCDYTMAKDLKVSLPYNSKERKYTNMQVTPGPKPAAPAKGNLPDIANIVGVIEKLEWEGAVGSAIKIDFYVSQESSTQLKTAQQSVLMNTKVQQLGFWVADYDQEAKQWYEAAFPIGDMIITGIITGKENPEMNVDLTPIPVKDGIDVMVYKVSIAVAPAANKAYTLSFANSSTMSVVKAWGLEVGSLAKGAMG